MELKWFLSVWKRIIFQFWSSQRQEGRASVFTLTSSALFFQVISDSGAGWGSRIAEEGTIQAGPADSQVYTGKEWKYSCSCVGWREPMYKEARFSSALTLLLRTRGLSTLTVLERFWQKFLQTVTAKYSPEHTQVRFQSSHFCSIPAF